MASQKSSAAPTPSEPIAPKRTRGRQRVTAILDAGADVLAERGFEAATMSEIAARADTAIGSLYRFFPTKAALGEALAQRYLGELGAHLDAIAARAPDLPPFAVADALIDMMAGLRRDRAAMVALIDGLDAAPERRAALRARMRDGIAAILRAAAPGLGAARAEIVAPVVQQLVKCAPRLDAPSDAGEAQAAELRVAIRLYLTHVLR